MRRSEASLLVTRRGFLKFLCLAPFLPWLTACNEINDPGRVDYINRLINTEKALQFNLLNGFNGLLTNLKPGQARVIAPGGDSLYFRVVVLVDLEWKEEMRYKRPTVYVRSNEGKIYEGKLTEIKDANNDSASDFLSSYKRNLLITTSTLGDPRNQPLFGPAHDFYFVIGDPVLPAQLDSPFALSNPKVLLIANSPEAK